MLWIAIRSLNVEWNCDRKVQFGTKIFHIHSLEMSFKEDNKLVAFVVGPPIVQMLYGNYLLLQNRTIITVILV